MVFLHCANLAALELSPRIPFPICFSAGVGQERDCVRLGRWKRNSHYEPKVLVVTDGEHTLRVRPHALVRVQISAVLSSRERLQSHKPTRPHEPLASLPPSFLVVPPGRWISSWFSGILERLPFVHSLVLHSGRPFSLTSSVSLWPVTSSSSAATQGSVLWEISFWKQPCRFPHGQTLTAVAVGAGTAPENRTLKMVIYNGSWDPITFTDIDALCHQQRGHWPLMAHSGKIV